MSELGLRVSGKTFQRNATLATERFPESPFRRSLSAWLHWTHRWPRPPTSDLVANTLRALGQPDSVAEKFNAEAESNLAKLRTQVLGDATLKMEIFTDTESGLAFLAGSCAGPLPQRPLG